MRWISPPPGVAAIALPDEVPDDAPHDHEAHGGEPAGGGAEVDDHVEPEGVEPSTSVLSGPCSPTELRLRGARASRTPDLRHAMAALFQTELWPRGYVRWGIALLDPLAAVVLVVPSVVITRIQVHHLAGVGRDDAVLQRLERTGHGHDAHSI